MIIVDTAVWIDHFDKGVAALDDLLGRDLVLMHPFVLGEIGLGNLPDRNIAMSELGKLPRAEIAEPDEVLSLISNAKLFGTGIGYVDAHLIAAAMLSDARVWTRDKRLVRAAGRLGVGY